MVRYHSFANQQEMAEYIRRSRELAADGLHPAQRDLTWASTWVQFFNVKERHLVFGKVPHILNIENGDEIAKIEARLEEGVLTAEAYDRLGMNGQLLLIPKRNVWPINWDTFTKVRDARWDFDALDIDTQLVINIAFVSWRAHLRSLRW